MQVYPPEGNRSGLIRERDYLVATAKSAGECGTERRKCAGGGRYRASNEKRGVDYVALGDQSIEFGKTHLREPDSFGGVTVVGDSSLGTRRREEDVYWPLVPTWIHRERVQRTQVVRDDAEFLFEFTLRGRDRLLALSSGATGQIKDPPSEWVPVLTRQQHILTVQHERRDRERDALIDLIDDLAAVVESDSVVHERGPTSVRELARHRGPAVFLTTLHQSNRRGVALGALYGCVAASAFVQKSRGEGRRRIRTSQNKK